MFNELIRRYPIKTEKPDKKRTDKNIAAVMSLIEKEEAAEKGGVRAKRGKKRLITAAAAIGAAACLTVTAGAAANRELGRLFERCFGRSSVSVKEYCIDSGSIRLEENFRGLDFEVTGLSADKNLIYLGLDITVKNGRTIPDDLRFSVGYIDDNGRCDGTTTDCFIAENTGKRASFLLKIFNGGNIRPSGRLEASGFGYAEDDGRGGVRPAADSIVDMEDLDGNDPRELNIYFSLNEDMPVIEKSGRFEIEMPMRVYDERWEDTGRESVEKQTATDISVSCMSVGISSEAPLYPRYGSGGAHLRVDAGKIFVGLYDGRRIGVETAGYIGCRRTAPDGTPISEGKYAFSINEPVGDISEIRAIIIGDTEISLRSE